MALPIGAFHCDKGGVPREECAWGLTVGALMALGQAPTPSNSIATRSEGTARDNFSGAFATRQMMSCVRVWL